jgi:alpha-tubulin suppressor-like RCC1 family protein
VEGPQDVRGISAAGETSLAVTKSGVVFRWGCAPLSETWNERPLIVDGFGGVRVRSVFSGDQVTFAIGAAGQLFLWGYGSDNFILSLGHGDTEDHPSPKRVEALRDIRVSSVSVGPNHALALTEDGLVYAWGENAWLAVLGDLNVERELLPKPVEALRVVRVDNIAAARNRSYAVAQTGEVWAWGSDPLQRDAPLGHPKQMHCRRPKPIESLRGINVVAVATSDGHTLARADDGSVYAWGFKAAIACSASGVLGLGIPVNDASRAVREPQRIPALHVACGEL